MEDGVICDEGKRWWHFECLTIPKKEILQYKLFTCHLCIKDPLEWKKKEAERNLGEVKNQQQEKGKADEEAEMIKGKKDQIQKKRETATVETSKSPRRETGKVAGKNKTAAAGKQQDIQMEENSIKERGKKIQQLHEELDEIKKSKRENKHEKMDEKIDEESKHETKDMKSDKENNLESNEIEKPTKEPSQLQKKSCINSKGVGKIEETNNTSKESAAEEKIGEPPPQNKTSILSLLPTFNNKGNLQDRKKAPDLKDTLNLFDKDQAVRKKMPTMHESIANEPGRIKTLTEYKASRQEETIKAMNSQIIEILKENKEYGKLLRQKDREMTKIKEESKKIRELFEESLQELDELKMINKSLAEKRINQRKIEESCEDIQTQSILKQEKNSDIEVQLANSRDKEVKDNTTPEISENKETNLDNNKENLTPEKAECGKHDMHEQKNVNKSSEKGNEEEPAPEKKIAKCGDIHKNKQESSDKSLCFRFLKNGQCIFDTKCFFDHQRMCIEIIKGKECNNNTCPYSHNQDYVCRKNKNNEKCRYGDRCRYIHIEHRASNEDRLQEENTEDETLAEHYSDGKQPDDGKEDSNKSEEAIGDEIEVLAEQLSDEEQPPDDNNAEWKEVGEAYYDDECFSNELDEGHNHDTVRGEMSDIGDIDRDIDIDEFGDNTSPDGNEEDLRIQKNMSDTGIDEGQPDDSTSAEDWEVREECYYDELEECNDTEGEESDATYVISREEINKKDEGPPFLEMLRKHDVWEEIQRMRKELEELEMTITSVVGVDGERKGKSRGDPWLLKTN